MTGIIENPGKKLAGGAKNYLDDLLALNAKTTQEMMRGISESYLDTEGAIELANRLGVEPPRVRRTFRFFFTEVIPHSLQVSAYDQETALAEAQRLHEFNLANNERYYGSGSRFNNSDNGSRRVYSALQSERPTVAEVVEAMANPHPWAAEFGQEVGNGENPRAALRPLQGRLRGETLIEEDRPNLARY